MSEVLEVRNRLLERLYQGRQVQVATKTRAQLIRDRIASHYSVADEIALINNYNLYLQNNALVQYKAEYDEYTAYRATVKAEVDNARNTI